MTIYSHKYICSNVSLYPNTSGLFIHYYITNKKVTVFSGIFLIEKPISVLYEKSANLIGSTIVFFSLITKGFFRILGVKYIIFVGFELQSVRAPTSQL